MGGLRSQTSICLQYSAFRATAARSKNSLRRLKHAHERLHEQESGSSEEGRSKVWTMEFLECQLDLSGHVAYLLSVMPIQADAEEAVAMNKDFVAALNSTSSQAGRALLGHQAQNLPRVSELLISIVASLQSGKPLCDASTLEGIKHFFDRVCSTPAFQSICLSESQKQILRQL